MRNLFLLLVLANLGFAAWYLWIVEPVTDVGATQVSDVPSISLVSELEESASEPTLAAAPVVPVARCVGPFSEFGRFVQALARLRSAGYTPTQRSEDGDVWLGHWGYLGDIATQGQAAGVIRTLAEHGIVDTAFDPAGHAVLGGPDVGDRRGSGPGAAATRRAHHPSGATGLRRTRRYAVGAAASSRIFTRQDSL
jgi:hypothetical protein